MARSRLPRDRTDQPRPLGENGVRSILRTARLAFEAGRSTQAAFILGRVWPHITPQMGSTTHAAADNLRVQLGIRGGI